jgi:hypothetical protein
MNSSAPEHYVVRIYRRQLGQATDPTTTLVGTVENASSGEKHTFHNVQELLSVFEQTKPSN